jgi:hypothetical protein
MNTRFLTVLITLTFLGFTVTAIAGKPTNFPDYNVEIEGAVSGGSIEPWGYNGKQVYSQRGRNELMNLDYFRVEFGPKGLRCFGGTDPTISTNLTNQMTNFGGFLRKHKKDAANGMFWFVGSTGDVPPLERKQVLYLLEVTGEFVGGPAGWPENENLMSMPNWTLKVENEGKDVARRSCEGSGTWDSGELMMVSVDVVQP